MTRRCLAVLLVLGFACSFELDLDSGPTTVAFEFEMSGADEMSGTVMIPVVLSRPADVEVTVDYALLAGDGAQQGVDFDLQAGRLTFAVGELRKELPVKINNDLDESEMVESFEIALTSPVGATLDQERAIHSVRISDHILPRVTIGPAPTSSSEGTPSMLLVQLDKPAEGTSTVVIGVAGGAPAPVSLNNDLSISDGTVVTFAANDTMKLVPIGEKEDSLDEEDNEIAVFTLRGASPNMVIGPAKVLNHSIADNDNPPTVRFNNGNATIAENVLLATLTVSLNTASGRQVRVDYARDNTDTADDGEAVLVSGTLTFDPGQTTKTIVIGIVNDNIDEDNETVVTKLTNAVNATLGTAVHTLTITDNDTATVTFQNASMTVDEDDAGTVNLIVRLATPSSKTVTVPYSRNGNSTATNGDDYTMAASPLVFQPGTTQLAIAVSVADNSPGSESDERLVVDLNTPTNAPLGNPRQHVLTITE